MDMQIWAITDRGAVRQQNQDSFFVFQPEETQGCILVCDGMGGAKAGNVASHLAVETFLSVLKETPIVMWEQDPHALMLRCAEEANQVIFQRSADDPECSGMGTTMVAALLLKDHTCVLNVGDSRAYLIRESEGIHQITRDHSVVEALVSRGKITPEAARVHPQKNLITRALGAESSVRCDLYDLTLQTGDFLLLCSDGLSNQMDDQEISYEVLHGGAAETCCERLLRLAMSRGAPDNVTVVLLQK